jgi:hypothetical protein
VGHPYWPVIVITFRNLAIVFFFVSAWFFLISAAWAQLVGGFPPPGHRGANDQKNTGHRDAPPVA